MSRRYFRPGTVVGHVLVLAAALTCLRLGWWQWTVFEEVGGTGQNLGYSLLWPVFAGSFIYMWLRFLHLEGTRGDSADEPADTAAESLAEPGDDGQRAPGPGPDAADGGTDGRGREPRHKYSTGHEVYTVGIGYIDEDDDDPELAAYNRALARLAEQDEHGAQ